MQKDPAAGEMQFVSGKLFIPAMQPGLDKNAANGLVFWWVGCSKIIVVWRGRFGRSFVANIGNYRDGGLFGVGPCSIKGTNVRTA